MDKELFKKKTDELTVEEKQAMLRLVAEDENARRAYIATRALQIQPLIEAESQIRQILTVEKLAAGAQPYYPIGSISGQTAWVAPGVGSAPRRTIEGDEMFVNTFALFARAEYLMDIATDGRWEIAKETEFNVAEDLKELENNIGWRLINAAIAHADFPAAHTVQIGSTSGVDMTTGKGFFSKQLLAELILAADVARRKITDIYVSPRTMFDIFNYWTGAVSGSQQFADQMQGGFATMPESGTETGEKVLNVFGVRLHKVYDSSIVDDETVYAFDLSGRRSKFGVMPVRQDLVTYEDPLAITEFKVGYFARMREGMAILDHTNAFVGVIDRS
jgi:hypothetical protein